MSFRLVILILFSNWVWTSSVLAKSISPTRWTLEALRLTGESRSVHDLAVKRLLKIPHLKSLLRQELKGPRRNLALDVIGSLGFEDFIPELLILAKSESSGIYYLSIDSLLTVKNQKLVANAYRERLTCAKACGVSPAVVVLLLDTLAQLQEKLSIVELQKLFDEGWYEVKSAVINYARSFLLRQQEFGDLALVKLGLESPIMQLRWQSIYLLKELPTALRVGLVPSLKKCEAENEARTPPEVLKTCLALAGLPR